ncbi:uncharacterized protein KY384_008337 [Bacidia gigantensis]|uniref:uncharacterized protein n=1 Tax=Bacidia gigantensis TaxID=2732470 RepID=UPI001D04E76A|nr:uncharacterized protein KY384_008337 [Bacidia gigantensis]KAG8526908.1 hypothetical protein KY384_008337 [Bacidia gigantensis]
MVSLWGSKNGEQRQAEEEGEQPSHEPSRQSGGGGHEADERTRLLPPRNDGYLDPDDPAVCLALSHQVSPYNLWSVRALRYVNLLFLCISFLWWVLLLISIFISPPSMNSRGSGFFDFSYTTLTLGNLLLALLFFSVPSKVMEWGSLILAFFLLVDMIVICAVSRLRLEEGWPGIASVVWATFMAIYNVVTDRVVAWGKREEEVRLTGRRESRRSLREWCAVLTASIIMVVLIIVSILLTATLILRAKDASLAPPGKRYDVNGGQYQLHFDCIGNITYGLNGKPNPTILLEGPGRPVEDSFTGWVHNAYKNGTIDRYCYYDRPGYAWSDNAPSPHSAGMTANALAEVLARAGEEGPWILVSAGIGGIYSRIFSGWHKAGVKGLMLIDSMHEDLLHNVGSPTRGFLLWARGIISPLGWDRVAGAIKGRSSEDRVYGPVAYQNGKFIKARLQENLVAESLTKSDVSQARTIQDEKTPLVIISSGIRVRTDRDWERKQKDLTKLTDNLLGWDVVNAAPHEVWTVLQGRDILEKRLGELVKAS